MAPLVFVAGAIACYFAYRAVRQPHPATFVAAVLWLLYAIYEVWITQDPACAQGCNIRPDLMVIWPVLAIATVTAVSSSWKIAGKRVLVVVAVIVGFLAAPALGFIIYGKFFDRSGDQTAQPPPSNPK